MNRLVKLTAVGLILGVMIPQTIFAAQATVLGTKAGAAKKQTVAGRTIEKNGSKIALTSAPATSEKQGLLALRKELNDLNFVYGRARDEDKFLSSQIDEYKRLDAEEKKHRQPEHPDMKDIHQGYLTEISRQEQKLKTVQEQEAQMFSAITDLQRLVDLGKTVDVSLKSASVQQVATAIMDAANVGLFVADGVSKSTYISITAQSLPLGTLLETVAANMNLIIAPGENGGYILRNESKLSVNGKTITFRGDIWPWSDDWGTISGNAQPVGRRWLQLLKVPKETTTLLNRFPELKPENSF